VFEQMDKNKTGMIDAKELSAYLKSKNESLSQQEVNDMIKELDYQGNGKINWSEFLAATIDTEKFLTE
jgi:Ca2+-binding EF-hand superfamily protein